MHLPACRQSDSYPATQIGISLIAQRGMPAAVQHSTPTCSAAGIHTFQNSAGVQIFKNSDAWANGLGGPAPTLQRILMQRFTSQQHRFAAPGRASCCFCSTSPGLRTMQTWLAACLAITANP